MRKLLLFTLLCTSLHGFSQENLKYRFFHSVGAALSTESFTLHRYVRETRQTDFRLAESRDPVFALGSLYYNLRINLIQYKPGVALSVSAVPTGTLFIDDGIFIGTPLVMQLELFGGSTYWSKHLAGVSIGFGREFVTSLFDDVQYSIPVFTAGVRVIGRNSNPIEIALKIGKFDLFRDTQDAIVQQSYQSSLDTDVYSSFRLGLLFMLDY